MKILFAEDDRKVGKHVKDALTAEGYTADWAQDGQEALWLAENYHYDLIVLDIMLPERDGISILRQLRRSANTVPVLFLTARSDVHDRAFGLDAGADDYLVKPFSVVELLARVRALFRRQRPELTNRLTVEDLEMDLLARTVTRAGQLIVLTNREFSLLELLVTASPKPVSKAMIIDRVWDRSFDSETNLVNVYVNHLRKKIDLPGRNPLLQTIRGVGFVLRTGEK
ncbi:MAG TPA: response regulator transcription factor [Candidatus Saccharimonadales bacterium]|nr:response regulator transcription factor [Candidatus Saccharimonadales bacterium]